MDNRLPAGLRGRVIFGKGNEVTIGDRIRRIRKKRRLTQAELAMMSGLSLSAIQGYEQGRYEPKRKSLESIAEVFKIPVYELYDTPAQLSTNLAEVGTDCISRQDALEAFGLSEKTRKYGGDHSGYATMMMYEIQDTIENLPPIQPEIIRCKDCKYARLTNDGSCKYCDIWFPDEAEYMDGDYYCASAERKSNE